MPKALYSKSELAVELEKDRATIGNALRNVPSDGEKGGYPAWHMMKAVRAVFLNNDASKLNAEHERARKDKELADRVALQNAVTRNELFLGSIVTHLVAGAFLKVRLRLLAIPTKLAPTVVHLESISEIQAKLRDGINDVLRELNEESVLRAAGTDTASSVGDVSELVRGAETAADSDCKPVGRPRAATVPRSQRGAWEMGHEPS